MFTIIQLDVPSYFSQLSNDFEFVTKGRSGAIVVSPNTRGTPIVRSTTIYTQPPALFSGIHNIIISKIQQTVPVEFNNAMVEVYDNSYRTMKFHSDLSLDLVEGSYIGIFSCYSDMHSNRKLVICNKTTKEQTTLPLEHNSVILFSTETNRNYLHKIICDTYSTNKWLGVTFRLSKTYYPETSLTLATEEEKKAFYKLRSQENKLVNFTYPQIMYTISPSDLMTPNT